MNQFYVRSSLKLFIDTPKMQSYSRSVVHSDDHHIGYCGFLAVAHFQRRIGATPLEVSFSLRMVTLAPCLKSVVDSS